MLSKIKLLNFRFAIARLWAIAIYQLTQKTIFMDIIEKEYVVKVINYFWGQGTAATHQVNDQAATVTFEALTVQAL